MYFSWSTHSLQRTMQRRVLQLWLMPLLRQMCFEMFNERKTWKMADLDIFALGKTFQEIVCKKGWALKDPFKEDFRMIQAQLLHPNQDLQQAGLELSG